MWDYPEENNINEAEIGDCINHTSKEEKEQKEKKKEIINIHCEIRL
jgi:hypothetical protein